MGARIAQAVELEPKYVRLTGDLAADVERARKFTRAHVGDCAPMPVIGEVSVRCHALVEKPETRFNLASVESGSKLLVVVGVHGDGRRLFRERHYCVGFAKGGPAICSSDKNFELLIDVLKNRQFLK